MALSKYTGNFLSFPLELWRSLGTKVGARRCLSDARIDGKTVIITGGNAGIGKETAIDLAKRGGKIIICCRDLKRAEIALQEIKEKSGSENVKICQLDLASFKSVREAAKYLLETEPQIHILINNAGVMACPRAVTEDGNELQFQTNHLGHFLFTLLLLDRIKASAPARIINVSSAAHFLGSIKFNDINSERSYWRWSVYGQSKLANILFTRELARRLEGTGVTVYALHPGFVRTELDRHIKGVTRIFFSPSAVLFAKSPVLGAQTSIYCAVDEKAGQETGLYYGDCAPLATTSAGKNDETARRLWDLSLKMVKLDTDPTVPKNREI